MTTAMMTIISESSRLSLELVCCGVILARVESWMLLCEFNEKYPTRHHAGIQLDIAQL